MFDLPLPHLLVVVSAVLMFVGGYACVRDTLSGNTKPNRVSWFLWALAPLISGQIKVETVKLIEPVIHLERLSDGTANWEFKVTAPEPKEKSTGAADGASAPGASSAPAIALDNLSIVREGISKSAGTASNTLVRSTIDGMVLDVPIKRGNSVIERNNFNEGTTIASVADMKDLIFEGELDESEVGKVSLGMPIVLTIGAIDDASWEAELEYIAPKGVEEEGAIQFKIKDVFIFVRFIV